MIGFNTNDSAQTRSIGAQEECSPTLRAAVTPAVAVKKTEQYDRQDCERAKYERGSASGMTYLDVEMEVAVRKYEIDIEGLKELLRSHKKPAEKVALALDVPKTMAEHWFRRDKYFAIPTPEIWPALKEYLGIESAEFDKSIMEYEFKGGNYDTRNRIYLGDASPTLTIGCQDYIYLLK